MLGSARTKTGKKPGADRGRVMWKRVLLAALFILPLVVYGLIFFENEPYNFWGLRGDTGDVDSPVTMIRRIENDPDAENIILSASRLAPLVAEELNEAGFVDEEWLNLSFVGAQPEEQCDMFWLAAERLPLKKVVYTLCFWSVTDKGIESRVEREAPIAESGVTYVASPESHWGTWDLVRSRIPGLFQSTPPSLPPIPQDEGVFLEGCADYVDRVWVPFAQSFTFDLDALAEIIKMCKYCEENGIDLRIVTFPNRHEVYDCLGEYGLLSMMEFYKDVLAQYAPVYDMEYPESKWVDDLTYMDGCHFYGVDDLTAEDYRQIYPMQTDIFNVMFHGEGEEVRVLDHELTQRQLVCANDVTLKGDGEVQVWYENVQLEPGSVYVASLKGDIPEGPEFFYVDLLNNAHGADGRLTTSFPVTSEETGERLGLLLTTDLLQERDFLFRVVYQGSEDLVIDSLELSIVERKGAEEN